MAPSEQEELTVVVRRATERVASARQEQIAAMRRAASAGVTLRRIGEAAGISHSRVSQILSQAKS